MGPFKPEKKDSEAQMEKGPELGCAYKPLSIMTKGVQNSCSASKYEQCFLACSVRLKSLYLGWTSSECGWGS